MHTRMRWIATPLAFGLAASLALSGCGLVGLLTGDDKSASDDDDDDEEDEDDDDGASRRRRKRSRSSSGCTRDTDCKGSRVCESGSCVDPPTDHPSPPPIALPPPSPAPAPAQPAPRRTSAVPGGPCTHAQESTSAPCRCAGGRLGSMVCFGRSLTWSACNCPRTAPRPRPVRPNKRFPCTGDHDCNPPYKCGYQGNCMRL